MVLKENSNMTKVGDLLLAEAQTTKQLYKIAATRCKLSLNGTLSRVIWLMTF